MQFPISRKLGSLICCLITSAAFCFSARAQGHGDMVQRGKPSELVKAVQSNKFAELQRLLASDIDVNEFHFESQTALMAAALYERTEFVKALIEAGADVNKKNSAGWNALIWAAQQGNAEIVEILIKAGADINAVENSFEYSALMWAARDGNLKTVELLIDARANLHQKGKYGNTAFLLAAEGGKPDTIKKLLSLGFDVNATDDEGERTALIAAARYPETLKVLIKAGAKVNGRSRILSHTALYAAAMNGWAESVKVLIDAGADVNIPDFYGNTPLFVANTYKRAAVVELLQAAGGKEKVKRNEQ